MLMGHVAWIKWNDDDDDEKEQHVINPEQTCVGPLMSTPNLVQSDSGTPKN